MKLKLSHSLLLPALLLLLAAQGARAQKIDNEDFAKGKSGWTGDGKEVFTNAAGEVSETKKEGFSPVIRIELSKSAWKGLKQRLRPKSDETKIDFALQVKADAKFKREAESRAYSNGIDFKEGGQYGWSAEVYPKCDFLVRVKDEGWQYRPVSLAPLDAWKTVSVSISGLKGRQRELELLFPPGEGTVYLKGK